MKNLKRMPFDESAMRRDAKELAVYVDNEIFVDPSKTMDDILPEVLDRFPLASTLNRSEPDRLRQLMSRF